MKRAVPVQSFRIRPLNTGALYFDVKIFATKKDMYGWFRDFTRYEKRIGCNFEAIVLDRHRFKCTKKYCRSIPHVATMLFVRSRMTMNIVTHESGHAALAWFRRKYWHQRGVDINTSIEIEERFCYVLGDIARQLVGKTS